jgi:putative tryptophan/tyrosine transport system substrate-binding protein
MSWAPYVPGRARGRRRRLTRTGRSRLPARRGATGAPTSAARLTSQADGPHDSGMDRRRFLVSSLAGAVAAPLAGAAQQAGKVYRIGYVTPAPGVTAPVLAFDRVLRDSGLIEGANAVIDRQFMGGREDQYGAVLADLERRVDVIVVSGPPAALAAKQAVTRVPVIFAAVGDPVGLGLVQSLAKPGGNLTGVSFDVSPDIAVKRLGLLKEIFPALVRVAALWQSQDPVGLSMLQSLQSAAPRLPVQVRPFDVRRAEDFDDVFRDIVKERLNGILVIGGPVNVIHQKRIVDFAKTQRLPAISISRDYVVDGGLMSYGPNLADNIGHAATFVARILKGARPADLPVEQPTRFELVINARTARALGLTLPSSLLARADQVIE